MKFLVFNITVAAALIYLLTTDRADVQNTVGRIHDAAAEMKQAAVRVVDRGRSLVGRTSNKAETVEPTAAFAVPPASGAAQPAPRAFPMDTPDRQVQTEAPPPPLRRGKEVAAAATNAPPPAPAGVAPDPLVNATAAADPKEAAALRRREEILRGIDPAVLFPGSKTEEEPAPKAVSPAERRKQLYALSEEMELFYVRTLGK